MKKPFPYSVSEWANIGKERGYWDFFAEEIKREEKKRLYDIFQSQGTGGGNYRILIEHYLNS